MLLFLKLLDSQEKFMGSYVSASLHWVNNWFLSYLKVLVFSCHVSEGKSIEDLGLYQTFLNYFCMLLENTEKYISPPLSLKENCRSLTPEKNRKIYPSRSIYVLFYLFQSCLISGNISLRIICTLVIIT